MSTGVQRTALREFYRAITHATPGGAVVEGDGGVLAAIIDAAPDRSIPNATVYSDGEELLESLDDIADA